MHVMLKEVHKMSRKACLQFQSLLDKYLFWFVLWVQYVWFHVGKPAL